MVKVRVLNRSDRPPKQQHSGYFSLQKMRYFCAGKFDLSTNSNREASTIDATEKSGKKKTKKFTSCLGQPWEKHISVIVHLVALVILSLMVIDETKMYRLRPTGTAVDDDMYPVQKIDFPAVAICNLNVLSRTRVLDFAHELWELDKVRKIENLTLERLQDLLQYMGHFFTFNSREDEFGDIELLEKVFVQAFGSNYIVPRLMDHLIPQCRQSFDHCAWAGEIRSCEELFIPRWTQDGHCCTFNYVRWTESISEQGRTDYSFHTAKSEVVGYEYGLRVLLSPHFNDNYYNIMAGRGFKILVYAATDYPDKASGGLKEFLIGPGTENHFKVKGTSFYSSPDVINYDKDKRQCLFNTELADDFGGTYSYSQCLMLCRARHILRSCGCIPFYYPYSKEFEIVRDCSVMDLNCLEKSWFKWHSIRPYDVQEEVQAVGEMFNESMTCDCLPACESVDLAVFQTGSPIHHYDISLMDFVQNYDQGNVTKDSILLHISFERPTIVRLRQDVLYYWYDLMGTYGGLCGIFLGVSIITPIEHIYNFSIRMWDRSKKLNKLSVQNELPAIVEPPRLQEHSIYWRELIKNKQKY